MYKRKPISIPISISETKVRNDTIDQCECVTKPKLKRKNNNQITQMPYPNSNYNYISTHTDKIYICL